MKFYFIIKIEKKVLNLKLNFSRIYELEQCFKQLPVQAIEFKIKNKQEFLNQKLIDACLEAEFYLDKQIPELNIYQI